MAKISVLTAVGFLLVISQSAWAQTAMKPQDFVATMTQDDQYEQLAATTALAESHNAEVLSFARLMLHDHTRLAGDRRQAAAASGLPSPPAALSSDQAMMLASLQSVRGPNFDRAYARQQVLAHVAAIAVESSFADGGSESALQKTAQDALSTSRDHLEMAEQLQAGLQGS